MAVVDTYSSVATNQKATPPVNNPTTATEGTLHCTSDYVSVASADSDGSKYYLAKVHSSWCIKNIWLKNDAITSGTSYDLGLYTCASTPVVVDVDAYGSAIDMSSARTTAPIDGVCEARDIIKINKKVYEDAGLTTDSGAWYWLTLTANTVGSADGDISFQINYTY